MLAEKTTPTSHAGEDQSSGAGEFAARTSHWSNVQAGLSYFINRPEVDAESLSQLIVGNDWLRPGDIIHVAEIRRHILTDDDLNAAARAVIGAQP